MTDNELKPCPFCGGEDAYLTRNCYGENYVRCPNCGACVWGKDDERPSEKQIINIWNARQEARKEQGK